MSITVDDIIGLMAAAGALIGVVLGSRTTASRRRLEQAEESASLLEATAAKVRGERDHYQGLYEIAREHIAELRPLLRENGVSPPPLPDELKYLN